MAISEEHVNVSCNLIWSCYVKKNTFCVYINDNKARML